MHRCTSRGAYPWSQPSRCRPAGPSPHRTPALQAGRAGYQAGASPVLSSLRAATVGHDHPNSVHRRGGLRLDYLDRSFTEGHQPSGPVARGHDQLGAAERCRTDDLGKLEVVTDQWMRLAVTAGHDAVVNHYRAVVRPLPSRLLAPAGDQHQAAVSRQLAEESDSGTAERLGAGESLRSVGEDAARSQARLNECGSWTRGTARRSSVMPYPMAKLSSALPPGRPAHNNDR
jgi:hypothetical protein